MKTQLVLGFIVMIALWTIVNAIPIVQQVHGLVGGPPARDSKAPIAASEENVYISWWTNKTGNDEVMFRASTDGGITFGDKINLSNTTDSDSTRVEIEEEGDSVYVTWWETNQTDDTPVARVSTDNGATFGPLLALAANGTIGEPEEARQE